MAASSAASRARRRPVPAALVCFGFLVHEKVSSFVPGSGQCPPPFCRPRQCRRPYPIYYTQNAVLCPEICGERTPRKYAISVLYDPIRPPPVIAVQKRPQAFLDCQYKISYCRHYRPSKAEAILNRPAHLSQLGAEAQRPRRQQKQTTAVGASAQRPPPPAAGQDSAEGASPLSACRRAGARPPAADVLPAKRRCAQPPPEVAWRRPQLANSSRPGVGGAGVRGWTAASRTRKPRMP